MYDERMLSILVLFVFNFPSATAYGVDISQRICFPRVSSNLADFDARYKSLTVS